MQRLPNDPDIWARLEAAAARMVARAPEVEGEIARPVAGNEDDATGPGVVRILGLPEHSSWDFASMYDVETGCKIGVLGTRDPEWEATDSQLYATDAKDIPEPGKRVRLVASTVDFQRLLETLQDPQLSGKANRDRLGTMLLEPATYLPRLDLGIPCGPPRSALNREQAAALRLALSEAPVTLIEGPPGTGKTTVIAEIIRQAILGGRRVLCISPTHQAVDNVISRLRKEELPFVPIRVGRAERVGHGDLTEANRSGTIERYLREERLPGTRIPAQPHGHLHDPHLARITRPEAIEAWLAMLAHRGEGSESTEAPHVGPDPDALSEARRQLLIAHVSMHETFLQEKLRLSRAFPMLDDAAVSLLGRHLDQRGGSPVFGTATGFMAAAQLMASEPGGSLPFDILIVDEASKMTLSQFVPGALRARKLVLVGDSRQLPPFVDSAEQKALLEHGVPSELVIDSIFRHLERTLLPCYKASLVKQYRMHRDIVHFPNWAFYQGRLRTSRPDGANYLQKLHRVTWSDVPDGEERAGTSWVNRRELQRVRTILLELDHKLAGQSGVRTVGALSFYKGQKQLLDGLLASLSLEHLRPVAGTVDSFQGEEMDIVIISFVRSRRIGFLDSPQRLNVAMTRAKDYLYLVGDARFMSRPEFLISGIFHHQAMSLERQF